MNILATGSQRAGKTSQVNVGGTALAFSSYNVSVTGVDHVTNNFTSYNPAGFDGGQAFDEGLLCFVKADIDFGGDWDAGLNPYDDPPGLYPRDDLQTVKFYTSILDVVDFAFPYIRLRSCKVGSTAEDSVTFECGGMNQGIFTLPTGSN